MVEMIMHIKFEEEKIYCNKEFNFYVVDYIFIMFLYKRLRVANILHQISDFEFKRSNFILFHETQPFRAFLDKILLYFQNVACFLKRVDLMRFP